MDENLEKEWTRTVSIISKNFGEEIDVMTILFLIGMQELDKGYQKLNKDQKLEVIHIGLCVIFEPYGYYTKSGRDNEGWPHFEQKNTFSCINVNEQESLIKKAIINYFIDN